MNRCFKLLPVAVVALLVLATAGSARGQEVIGLPVGARPDAAQIEDLDGGDVDLSQYIGQGVPVLVEFWATWCANCRELEPQIYAAREKHGSEIEILIVAVAVNQSIRRVRRHFEDRDVPGHLLWDGEGRAVRAFKAPATSYVVILDGEGRVAYTGLGPEQDLESAIAQVLEQRD